MSRQETVAASFVAPILDLLPDAIIWVRPVKDGSGGVEDFEIGYSNQPADAGIRHPKGRLAGLHILRDGVPSRESAQANFQHFFEVYSTGKESEHTFYAHHSGRRFETRRVVYEGGVLSTTRDRQAQRVAEQKEREKTLLLDGIISHAPVGIQVYEAVRNSSGEILDFRIRLYNGILHALTGISEEERGRFTFKQLLQELKAEEVFSRYVNTVETGQPFAFDYQAPRSRRWLHLSVVKLGDGVLLMVTDIAGSKESEQLLQQQSGYLNSILNTSLYAVVTMEAIRDRSGNIIDFRYKQVNRQFTAWLQKTEEEITGSTMLELFPNTKDTGIFEAYRQVIETGRPVHTEVYYREGA